MLPPDPPLPRLSHRHVEIITLIGREGLPNKVVAFRLGITLHTLRTHLKKICFRIGVAGQSREAVVAFYWRHERDLVDRLREAA